MLLSEIAGKLGLKALSEYTDLDVTGGFVSDLLSDVVGHARPGNILVTIQVHKNVVAVASLVNLGAVIIAEGRQPPPDMLEAARSEEVNLFSADESSFDIVGKLYAMGVRSA
ncbi:hypothetical protein GX586_05935 [bacterium]|nr:hypothetical protein [bacterium]